MSGVKGKSGRRPMEIELKRRQLKLMDYDYLAIDVIKHALENGDKNIAMYVYDHNHGKAKQTLDSRTLSLNASITGEQLMELRKQWQQQALEVTARLLALDDAVVPLEAPSGG